MNAKTPRMTASKLRDKYETNNPEGKFFTPGNMKFAGDTMSNYYVPAQTVFIRRHSGDLIECYELQRKRPSREGLTASAFFTVADFKLVHGEVTE